MASSSLFIVVLCLGLCYGTSVLPGSESHCKVCLDGWTTLENRCYKFFFGEKTWAEAQRHCTDIGGSLTSIHGTKEYQAIRAMIKELTNTHKKTWVGGYDAAQDGVWLWSDNTVFDFKGWGNGEPNGGGREHCMEINFRGQDYVNDIPCHLKRSFMCATDL